VCGRYATARSSVDLATLFEAVDETGGELRPAYNVAPTDPVPIVTTASGGRTVRVARWGLVPPWARDARVGVRMINARSETLMSSNAFAPAFRSRRCLVPADGWYEWRTGPTGKQAYYLTRPDGEVLAFAGVWAVSASGLVTCSIITAAAIGHLASVHDRMPLIMTKDRWAGWLCGLADPATLLLVPSVSFLDSLEIRPVGPAVGNVRNDGPSLTQAVHVTGVAAEDVQPTDLTLF
jgi:putative SOS response-associated peptidase YedK